MLNEKLNRKQKINRGCVFDWEACIDFIFDQRGESERIGKSWPLLFVICSKVDRSGMYSSTYRALSMTFGVSPITVKKWKQHLCGQGIIEAFSHGARITFHLLSPYFEFMNLQGLHNPNHNENSNVVLMKTLLTMIKNEQKAA